MAASEEAMDADLSAAAKNPPTANYSDCSSKPPNSTDCTDSLIGCLPNLHRTINDAALMRVKKRKHTFPGTGTGKSCDCVQNLPCHRTAIISRGYTTGNCLDHITENKELLSNNYEQEELVQNISALIIENPNKAFAQYVQALHVYDVVPVNTKFVVLDITLGVRKAFYALIYNGVRSALLWDGANGNFCGLLTVTDFINILLQTYKNSPEGAVLNNIEDHLIMDWRDMLSKENKLKPLLSINANETLLEATKKLIKARFHRIPIFDDAGTNALHFLTHKRILRFLYLVIEKLPVPSFMSKSIRQLNVGTYENLLTVSLQTPMIECFKQLVSRNVSAVPVLDSDGKVVDIYAKFDAISVAAEGSYSQLDLPVGETLERRRRTNKWYKGVITCTENNTLREVVDRLHSTQVHGLIVVDQGMKLRGVVTLYDVLKFMIVEQV